MSINIKTTPSRKPCIILTILLFCLSSCNIKTSKSENGYMVHGMVKAEILYGEKAVLTIYNSDGTLSKDSTTIDDEGRFSFVGEISKTCLSELEIKNPTTHLNLNYHFFLENNDITVTIMPAKHEYGGDYFRFKIRGSNADKRYRRESKDAYIEYPGFVDESFEDLIDECLAKHPNAFYAPYLYFQTKYSNSDYPDFVKQMKAFTGDALESYHYKLMSEKCDEKSRLAIHNKIPNFTMRNEHGDTVNLLKTAAGQQYVLIDFWASWCGPCRHEFEMIKKLHCRYHDKGFEVIGVSIDEDSARWKKALKDEKLPWVNVIDSGNYASTVFSVTGVPANFLIDNTGKILARNLHGTELEQQIDNLMTSRTEER